jgi:thioredoxin 1
MLEIEEDFEDLLQDSSKPLVLYMTAPWCRPCKAFQPVAEEVFKSFGERIAARKVNVDDYPELVAECGISSVPAVAVFIKGQLAFLHTKAVPRAELQFFMEKMIEQSKK